MVFTDYAQCAENLELVIAGNKAGPFKQADWRPKVRGEFEGASVTVAYYELDYSLKAEALAIGRKMLLAAKKKANG